MTGTRRLLTSVAIVSIVATGCALDDSGLLAVQRPDGDPTRLAVVFGHCADGTEVGTDRLTAIEVRAESTPVDEAASDDDADFGRRRFDRVVWSVEAKEPTALDSVVVGTEPEGFTTVTELAGPLPDRVLVVAHSAEASGDEAADRGVAELGVSAENVPSDPTLLLDEVGLASRDEFLDRVSDEACAEAGTATGRSTLGSSVTGFLVRVGLLFAAFLAATAAFLAWRRRGDGTIDDEQAD